MILKSSDEFISCNSGSKTAPDAPLIYERSISKTESLVHDFKTDSIAAARLTKLKSGYLCVTQIKAGILPLYNASRTVSVGQPNFVRASRRLLGTSGSCRNFTPRSLTES